MLNWLCINLSLHYTPILKQPTGAGRCWLPFPFQSECHVRAEALETRSACTLCDVIYILPICMHVLGIVLLSFHDTRNLLCMRYAMLEMFFLSLEIDTYLQEVPLDDEQYEII